MELKRVFKNKAVWILLFCTGLSYTSHAQQDAQFSQYIFNGLYVNPAYAGYKEDIYLNAFYRSQWTGLEGAPQTSSIAVDGAVHDNRVGLGLLMAYDKIGAQSSLLTYANYAYRLQIGDNEESHLAFGLGAGIVQNGIDGSKLNAVQADDNYIPAGFQSVILPDARLGVLYTNESFFAGFSVDNLLARALNDTKNRAVLAPIPVPHFYLTGGALFNINDQVRFKPSFLIKDDKGGPTSLDLNAFTLLNDRIWIGGTYRTAVPLYNKPHLQNTLQKSNAVIGMVEFFATENFRIGYAFDYSLTPLRNYSYGSHEISIGIYLRPSNESSSFNKCFF